MANQLYKFILLLILVSLFSCTEDKVKFADEWTDQIKEKILEDASQLPDSVHTEILHDSIRVITSFRGKALLKRSRIRISSGDTLSTLFFGNNQDFVLGYEYCPLLGNEFAEVVAYKKTIFGMHRFYFCDGKIKREGVDINGYVGQWKDFDENGDIIRTVDYGNEEKLDTLKYISYK